MPIERDHLYIIPPGTYLSVVDGLCTSRNPRRVMARGCRSISCCNSLAADAERDRHLRYSFGHRR